MCTVSVISAPARADGRPIADRLLARMVVNRDERRTRGVARPPVVVATGRTRAVMPVDPDGGGTWVAATDAGLAFALLNGRAEAAPANTPSRGLIIPGLLDATSADEVARRLLSLDLGRHRPWRLIVVDARRVVLAQATGDASISTVRALESRLVVSSSSLDEPRVVSRRARLFDEIVHGPDPDAQDRFHAHQWPDCPADSVLMARPDARTVSRTVIEIRAGRVVLAYDALDGGNAAIVELPRRPHRQEAA